MTIPIVIQWTTGQKAASGFIPVPQQALAVAVDAPVISAVQAAAVATKMALVAAGNATTAAGAATTQAGIATAAAAVGAAAATTATGAATGASGSAAAAGASASVASTAAVSASASQAGASNSAGTAATVTAVAGRPYPNIFASQLPQGITNIAIGGTAITGATPSTTPYPLVFSGGSYTGMSAGLLVTSATAAQIVWGTTAEGKPAYGLNIGGGTTLPTIALPTGANLPSGVTLTPSAGVLIAAEIQTYWVQSSDGTLVLLYGNHAGAPTPAGSGSGGTFFGGNQLSLYGATAITGALGLSAPANATNIPLVTVGYDVPVFLTNGLLDALGIGPTLALSVINTVLSAVDLGTTGSIGSASFIPLASVGKDVVLWLEYGLLATVGLSPGLITTITAAVAASASLAPINATASTGRKIIATDARSLRQYRRKRAQTRIGGTQIYRVAFIGDSWTEKVPLPQAIANMLYADTQRSGYGWITIGGASPLNAITVTATNWTSLYDMNVAGAAPVRGCGPDGFAQITTNTTATLNVSGFAGSSLSIYYWDGNGTFTYRVDGGTVTTVTCGNTGTHAKIALTGLGSGSHTLAITTVGNTGTVEIHGFLAENPATGGVVVHQIGNGGSSGRDYTNIKAHMPYFAADLAIDLAIINLTTNDYRLSYGTAQLVQGEQDIVTSLTPAAVLLIAPPMNGATGSPPQSSYRDALYTLATTQGWEFLNLFDAWDTYTVENAAGQWADTLHLIVNPTGPDTGPARRYADDVFNYFLK